MDGGWSTWLIRLIRLNRVTGMVKCGRMGQLGELCHTHEHPAFEPMHQQCGTRVACHHDKRCASWKLLAGGSGKKGERYFRYFLASK
jgi:hypothetical protein